MPFLSPKADLVAGSETFRPETGQKCLLQQMSLDRAVLRPTPFQKRHFSSVRSQCPPSCRAAPAPPPCLPLPMSLPPQGPPVGKRTPPGALSPVPCLRAHPRCAEEGQDKRHKPATCCTTAPARKDEASWKSGSPPHLRRGPACSGRRGPAPLTVGVRHFWHKSQHWDGWRAPVPFPESICSKARVGARGSCRHGVRSDKKQHQTRGCPNPAGHSP